MSERKQVVIAGAGPVGCVAALILSRAGISVTLLESEAELIQDLRASTFHPPTLDMLAELGITPLLIEQGLVTPLLQYRDLDDGLIAELDHAWIDDQTDHPFRLQCEQFKLTRVVAKILGPFTDTDIRFNSTVTGADQSGDGVTVTYDGLDGPAEIICDYLIGCDGSRSVVRKSQNIEFAGFTYPEQFVTVSASEDVDQIVPNMGHVAYISHPTEWCALIHAPDFWRFLFPISMETSKEEAFDDDFLQGRLKRLAPYDQDYTITHKTLYGVNQRVAETYRLGRILLAGDSAHVNNPLGGMGMNGGIHDGINLANKLVRILTEGASEDVLDQYDRQRRPIAVEYVQSQTIRNKKNLEEKDPAIRKQRQEELRAMAADREKARAVLMQTSMINSVKQSEAIQ